MDIHYRLATLDDLDDLAILVSGYHAFDSISVEDASLKNVIAPLLAADAPSGFIALAEIQGNTIGYLALCFGYSIEFGGRDAFVDELFVNESARNRGVGTGLMDYCKQKAAEFGVYALHLEVSNSNNSALRYYERHGFRPRSNFSLMSYRLS